MRVAIVGWGSLVWRPAPLVLGSKWRADGPLLPVEFARISRDLRITLVLVEGVDPVPTYWAEAGNADAGEVREALRQREKARSPGDIGLWREGDPPPAGAAAPVAPWAAGKGLAAVVWTALEPTTPPIDAGRVVDHLSQLHVSDRARAEEYIRRAPPQTQTAVRARVREALGWADVPLPAGALE